MFRGFLQLIMLAISLRKILTILFILIATSVSYSQYDTLVNSYLDSINDSQDLHIKLSFTKKLIAYYDSSNKSLAIPYIKQAITLSKKTENQLEEAELLTKLADIHYTNSDYDSAINTALHAIAIYKQLELEANLIPALSLLGRAYNSKTDFPKALKAHYEILDFFKAQPDTFENKQRRIVGQNINIAIAQYEMGYYGIATDYITSSLKTISLNKEWGIALKTYALKVMGMISMKLGDYKAALKNFSEVEKYQAESNEKNLPHKNKISEYISQTYFEMGEYDSALFSIKKAYRESIEKGKFKDAGIALNNTGEIYLKLNQYSKADQYFVSALETFEKNVTHKYIAIAKLNIAKSSIAQGKHEEVIPLLLDAVEESKTAKSKTVTRDCYEQLAEFYYKMEQSKKAYEYSKSHKILSDSILDEVKIKLISQSQQSYEIERGVMKSEKEALEAKFHAEQKSLEFQSIKRIYLTVIIFLLIIALVTYIWKEGEKAKRKASELSHQIKEDGNKHRIEQLVKDQELNKIRENLNGQENERKRIAKELHDGVGGSLAAIKILLQKLDPGSGQHLSNASKRLDQVCEEVRTISHHLTPPFMYHSSFITVIEQYALDISNTHSLNIDVKCFESEEVNAFDNDFKTDIYRMIQELVHNAVKHAKAQNITIQLSNHENFFSLMVEDDGMGVQNLNESKGIGLRNLEARAASLNGSLDIDSAIGAGTLVSIHIRTNLATEALRYE